MTADEVIEYARTWLGVPYQHQGRTRHGVDCLGLLVNMAQHFGVTDYDEAAYSSNPSGRHMRLMLDTYLHRDMYCQCPRKGDILHMAANSEPQHVAVVSQVTPLRIIHATSEAGKVIEQRVDRLMRCKIRGVYRIPGVQ